MGGVLSTEVRQELTESRLESGGQVEGGSVGLFELESVLGNHDVRVEAEVRIDVRLKAELEGLKIEPVVLGIVAAGLKMVLVGEARCGKIRDERDVRVQGLARPRSGAAHRSGFARRDLVFGARAFGLG